MVKRGGKEVITVEIFKETYDTMKALLPLKSVGALRTISTVYS